MPPSEFPKLTLTQMMAILDESDRDDPHRGNREIRTMEDLYEICGIDGELD